MSASMEPRVPTRVLYAEDSPLDADLTRVYLEEHAPEITLETAGTGAECLERLSSGAFDLLLLDNHLPDQDGVEVLRKLVKEGVDVPVVMVTGSGDEELVVLALRLGAKDYVPKRARYLEDLPAILRRTVAVHRERAARGEPAFPRPRRILCVEHLPMDVELAVAFLAETAPHYTLDVCRLAGEALERLSAPHLYDLLLVDLRMPDLGGLDLVQELRRRQLPLPPFIVITGKGDDDAAIGAVRLGAADYVTKRDGYLSHLLHSIDRTLAVADLERVADKLREELKERTRLEAQTRAQLEELRRWYDATLGREDRILELKREVNELLARAGEPPRYPSALQEGGSQAG